MEVCELKILHLPSQNTESKQERADDIDSILETMIDGLDQFYSDKEKINPFSVKTLGLLNQFTQRLEIAARSIKMIEFSNLYN